VIRPFSGHDPFPSGRTTIAFAADSALDRETSARWVPWVAYPIAGVVGWSRIRQDRHWTSDVVAGALLGLWSADKVGALELFKGVGRGQQRLFVAAGSSGRGAATSRPSWGRASASDPASHPAGFRPGPGPRTILSHPRAILTFASA
jgi:hypothetical protein